MYRGLGQDGIPWDPGAPWNSGDPWGSGPLDDPAPWVPPAGEVISPGPSSSPGGGSGPAVSWNIGDSIARFISAVTGGGSVRVQVPGPQGYQGSGGCPWNQCPTQAGPVVLCQPCATPAFRPTSVAGVISAPWFWPVAILAVVLLATSGKGRR